MAIELESISVEEFESLRAIRRGSSNPERMDNPLWVEMVKRDCSDLEIVPKFNTRKLQCDFRPTWHSISKSTAQRNFDLWAFSLIHRTWRRIERSESEKRVFEKPAIQAMNPTAYEVKVIRSLLELERRAPEADVEDIVDMLTSVRRVDQQGGAQMLVSQNRFSSWFRQRLPTIGQVLIALFGVYCVVAGLAAIWRLCNYGW
jgi:hypothetical protein